MNPQFHCLLPVFDNHGIGLQLTRMTSFIHQLVLKKIAATKAWGLRIRNTFHRFRPTDNIKLPSLSNNSYCNWNNTTSTVPNLHFIDLF